MCAREAFKVRGRLFEFFLQPGEGHHLVHFSVKLLHWNGLAPDFTNRGSCFVDPITGDEPPCQSVRLVLRISRSKGGSYEEILEQTKSAPAVATVRPW